MIVFITELRNGAFHMFGRLMITCLTGLLISCGGSGSSTSDINSAVTAGSDQEFNYSSVTQTNIDDVINTWDARELSPIDVQIVLETVEETHRITIVEHKVHGNKHYGAIIIPSSVTAVNSAPGVVFASGLTQSLPQVTVNIRSHPAWESFIQIIPVFRG